MGRMLRVIRAALPAGEEQPAGQVAAAAGGSGSTPGAASVAGAAAVESWRQHAEYEGYVRVLTWTGLGRTNVSWCPRYGVLYQVGGVRQAVQCSAVQCSAVQCSAA